MQLAIGAIGSLVPKLAKLLKDEYKLQKGVKESILCLSRELETAQAALNIVGEVPWDERDELVKLWARDVKEASYDMEDIIDTFLLHLDGPDATDPHMVRRLRKKMSKLFKKTKYRRKISKVVQEIKKKLDEVAARRGRYTVDNIAAKSIAPKNSIDPRLLNLYKTAAELVGINGPRNELIKRLSIGSDDDVADKRMKIVSIVGSGGMGKTTLAKVVYDQLKPYFECSSFVRVGQTPDMENVFRAILIDLDRDKYMDINIKLLDEMKLIDELKEFVQVKRSLIVIDDMWDIKPWKLIRCVLQDSKYGTRVLVTTRNGEIATYAGDAYEIEPLSHDDSKKLLYARINGDDGIFLDSPFSEACDKILKKCGGVPLAIITIASLLASKPGEYWSEIYNSVGFGPLGNDDVDNTRKILSFSYYDLPSHLKACLLYMSIFPDDFEIEKNGLIWRWIAEGFVSDEQVEVGGLFELGERYFNELINRSLIQPVEKDELGYVNFCLVHDMVLDLVRTLSRQENFVTVLDSSSEEQKLPRSIARRLALHMGDYNIGQLASMDVEKVRSLFANNYNIDLSVPRLPILRVLNMEYSSFIEDDTLENLLRSSLHLRYLRLTDTNNGFPREVRNLKFLQVLDLRTCYINELPDEVGLLTQLVCLLLGKILMRPGLIGKLTSLQELIIEPAEATVQFVNELSMLRELRVLRTKIDIKDKSMEIALLESLGNLHNIRTMQIWGSSLGKVTRRGAGFGRSYRYLRYLRLNCLVFSEVPEWIKSSLTPNLLSLYLQLTAVKEQDMETLGRLPELRYLYMKSCCSKLVSIKIPIGGVGYFRKLRGLKLCSLYIWLDPHDCENISSSSSSSAASTIMPSLESLELSVEVRSLNDDTSLHAVFKNVGRNSLERVVVELICLGVSHSEVDEAKDALENAVEDHPNCPILKIEDPPVSNYNPYYTWDGEAYKDARRTWNLANILGSEDIQVLRMPDSAAPTSKVCRLLYTNCGDGLLALNSNSVHKLWKWPPGVKNPYKMSTTAVAPELWQPASGNVLINGSTYGNREEATSCNALSQNDGYLISASGGKISLFNMMTFSTMSNFMTPPPAATFLALHPVNNNIIAIGMDDSSIEIYNIITDKVIRKLMGHHKRITGLSFALSTGVLVSSGADAQICAWNIDCWDKMRSTYIRPPSNYSGALVGDTMVQFDHEGRKILAVHWSQLAIYDERLECLCSWSPRDALPDPVSSAVYSSDSLLIYAGFYDGAIGIFEAESLTLQCRIGPSAYMPHSLSNGVGIVYPIVVAAHPFKRCQIAVGMSDGVVYVLEPPDMDENVEGSDSSGQHPDGKISSDDGGRQQSGI